MRNNICTQILGIGLLLLAVCLSVTSCSDANEVETTKKLDRSTLILRPIVVNGNMITRTNVSSTMTDVAMVGYEETIQNYQPGVSFTKVGGEWVVVGPFNWNTEDGTTTFACISPSFDICSGTKTGLKFNNRYFNFTLDPDNIQEFRIGLFITTLNQSQGVLRPSLIAGLAHVKFQVTQGINETVTISDIILHNFANTGRFTYGTDQATVGTWEIRSNTEYKSYHDVFSPITLGEFGTSTFVPNDEETGWIAIIPQTPEFWKPKNLEDKSIAYADANNLAYVEVKCKIVNSDGWYLWGNADNSNPDQPEYESLYLPINITKSKWRKGVTHNGYYTIPLTLDGGYLADGSLWEGHGVKEGLVSFSIPERVLFNAHVDNWIYDDEELDF